MKSKESKKKKKGKTLKKLKEEASNFESDNNISAAIKVSSEMIKSFPKNIYGYSYKIKLITNGFKKYVGESDLKKIKKLNTEEIKLATKKNKDKIKLEFDEYVNDLKEVENLNKAKKELTGLYLINELYDDGILYVNKKISLLNEYTPSGKKLKNIYDLLKGLFLFFCLLFNLFNKSYMLFLTIPFGIYGLIIIYNFFDVNFFKKGLMKQEKSNYNKLLDSSLEKISDLKEESKKINEKIEFALTKKSDAILRIPESFKDDLNELYLDNEKESSEVIHNEILLENDAKVLINNKTNLQVDELYKMIDDHIKNENEELNLFLNKKNDEKKNNQNKIILMKKIKPWNIFLMIFLLLISISSLCIIFTNFYDLNFKCFVTSIIVGIITSLVYNVNSGRTKSLTDVFNGNLMLTMFNSCLIYDLSFSALNHGIKFVYAFIEIPLILLLILIGFVMLISYFKYTFLQKKLKK